MNAVAETPQTLHRSRRVVSKLRKIASIRRLELAAQADSDPYELNRLIPQIDEIEVRNGISEAPVGNSLRVTAWNLRRGRYWKQAAEILRRTPLLGTDVLLATEMDLGMARSGNQHIARKLALELRMNYAYGVEFLELTKGEPEERDCPGENVWGYHGNAILSRYRLESVSMLRFPGIEKWFGDYPQPYQQRLGGRMALFAKIAVGGRSLLLASVHLETGKNAVKIRKRQAKLLIENIGEYSPAVLGGDFNATPDEPAIRYMRAANFRVEECNQLSIPTRESLNSSSGHIDYVCARGLYPVHDITSPKVVASDDRSTTGGILVSDHSAVTVLLMW
jgi:endonuclease/exonuclease/phosphatase family metal-dependent hydrolase